MVRLPRRRKHLKVDARAKGDELQPGQVFGGYEIVRQLGTGAFGAVYESLRMPLRKRTALKVLHREFVRYPDVLQRFLREAEIVAQMEHPHIVGVFDLGVHEGQPYLAMEFLDGETLADKLEREGVIPVAQAVDLMLAVTSAVSAVHGRGIVHRDLKPDNIFLARTATGATQPKLLDFGVVKVRDAGRALTMTRAMVGTPSYMSPEQAQEARDVDAPSDQWTLAVILFECLTGRCPFAGTTLLEILNAIATGPLPRLRAANPAMPDGLEAVLSRAMERNPVDRWPTARAFGEGLRPFASVGAQAQWEGFYATEGSFVQTVHQWSPVTSAPAGPITPRLAETFVVPDVEAHSASLESRTVAMEVPPVAPFAESPPSSRRWMMVAAGALVMTLLMAGAAAALYVRSLATPAVVAVVPQPPMATPPAPPPPLPPPPVVAPQPAPQPIVFAPPPAPPPTPAPIVARVPVVAPVRPAAPVAVRSPAPTTLSAREPAPAHPTVRRREREGPRSWMVLGY